MNVKLNVQGTFFETKFDNIVKIPYFKYMFEGENWKEPIIVDIDRPAHIFKHILALCVDPYYQFPKKYESELDFYDIDTKNIKFDDKYEDLKRELDSLKTSYATLTEKIKEDGFCIETNCFNKQWKGGEYRSDYCNDHFYIKNEKCAIYNCCNIVLHYSSFCYWHHYRIKEQ
jgi:hypothetical protein